MNDIRSIPPVMIDIRSIPTVGLPGIDGWFAFVGDQTPGSQRGFELRYVAAGHGNEYESLVLAFVENIKKSSSDGTTTGLAAGWDLDHSKETRIRAIEPLAYPKHVVIDVHFAKFGKDLAISFKRWLVLGPGPEAKQEAKSKNRNSKLIRGCLLAAVLAGIAIYNTQQQPGAKRNLIVLGVAVVGFLIGLMKSNKYFAQAQQTTNYENERAGSFFEVIHSVVIDTAGELGIQKEYLRRS